MARIRRVALLGNSVVASSLASTLRGRPELQVIQLGAATPDALMRLRDAHPEAIILSELTTTSPDLIFLLLREYPGVPVIRADVDGDRMIVLSGRQATLRTEDDLLGAIGQGSPLAGDFQHRSEGEREQSVGAVERPKS